MATLEEAKQALYQDTLKVFHGYVREYNAQELGVPDRLLIKAQAIFGAEDLSIAHNIAKRAQASGLVLYLSAWANKRIPGKITEHNAEQRAKKADSLADHLASIGQHDAAQGQRDRASRIRALVQSDD